MFDFGNLVISNFRVNMFCYLNSGDIYLILKQLCLHWSELVKFVGLLSVNLEECCIIKVAGIACLMLGLGGLEPCCHDMILVCSDFKASNYG